MSELKVTIGQLSDKGLKRGWNEDNCLAMPERGILMVADGVGGRRGGEVASRTVVEVFSRIFSQDHGEDLRTLVEGAIDLANQKIYTEAEMDPELEGMATTVAMVAISGSRAIVAHVGDSRVYRFDDQGLIALTEDHSEVNEALRAGIITEEQALNHPRKNVINRALGAEPGIEPDIVEIDIDEKTSFIICTDGITRHIADDEIERLMKSGQPPQKICERMKELCYAGGAEDNLTVIVADIGRRGYMIEEPTKPAVPKVPPQAAAAASGIPIPKPAKKIELDIGAAAPAAEIEKAPEKGELSDFMKWSLLILTTVAGLVIGVFLGRPVMDKLGSLFGSRSVYNRVGVERQPSDPEVNAAYARFLEGQTIEARDRLAKVITDNPDNAEANFYLGRIDYAQGRYDEAVSHLNQALRIDPALPDVRIHLAMAYLSIGQQRNARDVLQQVVAPGSTPAPLPSPSPSASPAGSPAAKGAKAVG